MRSLRLRLLVGSMAAISLALVLAWAVLAYIFENHVERRVERELETYIDQLASGLEIGNADEEFPAGDIDTDGDGDGDTAGDGAGDQAAASGGGETVAATTGEAASAGGPTGPRADEVAVVVTARLADPRFDLPLSGLYWQISEGERVVDTSRSLWDQTLEPPEDTHLPGRSRRSGTGRRRTGSG